jgi:glutamine synthetase
MKAAGIEPTTSILQDVTAKLRKLQANTEALEKLMEKSNFKSVEDEAVYKTKKILPAMLAVREVADALEGVVADDLWPLPSYQEMLFIK